MEENSGILIVLGVVALVILFNVGLALSFLRNRGKGQIFLFRDTLRKLVNPWKDEDEALSELRKRVAHLESQDHDEGWDDGF
jgi:hypothetical protein